MRTPVLVVARDGDIWIFRDADRAANWMEAQDVRDGEYRLFDCAGTQYQITADSDSSPVHTGHPISGYDNSDYVRRLASEYLAALPPQRRPQADAIDLAQPDGVCRALAPFAG